MKKLLLCALTVAATLCAGARSLSAEEAYARATSSTGLQTLQATGVSPKLIASDKANAYYVFATERQTIFVSGDDTAVPVLGYIDRPLANLDNISPTMRWWLDEYARQITWASQQPQRSFNAGLRRKAPLAKAERQNIAALVKTTWDQGSPYNNDCPKLNNAATYTGCVATAMAQVMYYHQWPAQGKGSVSYYWQNGKKTLSCSLAETIDWSNMLLTYKNAFTGTSAQRNAVAKLMKLCGYSCKMEYGGDSQGGSGATTSDMVTALVENFDYDQGITYELRDYYTTEQWEQMMYDNLLNVGPILYGGTGTAGGHQFICDGYRTDGYFHINWGWNGDSDGFFKLSALNPESLGAGGGAGGFNYNQDAVLNVRKPVAGSEPQQAYMAIEGTLTGTASGRVVTMTPGGTFAQGCGFVNMSPSTGLFNIGAILINKATGSSQYIKIYSDQTLEPMYGFETLQVTIPASVPNGDYFLTPAYQVNGSSQWTPFRYYVETGRQSLDITISDEGITIAKTPGEDSTDNITVMVDGSIPPFYTGQTNTFTAEVFNMSNTDLSVTIIPEICTADDEYYYHAAYGDPVIVEAKAMSTTPAEFTVTLPEDFEPGTDYYMVFTDNSKTSLLNYAEYTLTVVKGSGVEDITVDSADANAPRQYFNLQSQPVSHPQPGTLYIVRQGNKATKEIKR